MFNNILIPTDLSDHAERALEVAIELAPPTATLTLLHVIQTIQGVEFAEMESFYGELESRVLARLASLAARHADSGVAVLMEVAYGPPAAEILRISGEGGTDLVVLSSHSVKRDQLAAGWGTLSYKLGLLVTCPVLLVK